MVKYKNTNYEKKIKETEEIKLKPREKLLKYLIEHKEPVSIMQASGAICVDYKNTHNIVNEFQSKGILIKESIGNTNPVKINLIVNSEIFNVESKRTGGFLLKHPKLRIIKKYIEDINYPFLIVLLFGSYVKNKEIESSDIDICIVSDNKDKAKELQDKFDLLSLKLEIHDFTTKEFISMIEKKQNNLGNEIIKNNIILYGIENYYNLISKWMKKE